MKNTHTNVSGAPIEFGGVTIANGEGFSLDKDALKMSGIKLMLKDGDIIEGAPKAAELETQSKALDAKAAELEAKAKALETKPKAPKPPAA